MIMKMAACRLLRSLKQMYYCCSQQIVMRAYGVTYEGALWLHPRVYNGELYPLSSLATDIKSR